MLWLIPSEGEQIGTGLTDSLAEQPTAFIGRIIHHPSVFWSGNSGSLGQSLDYSARRAEVVHKWLSMADTIIT